MFVFERRGKSQNVALTHRLSRIGLALVIGSLIWAVPSSSAQETTNLKMSPLNSAFVDYLERINADPASQATTNGFIMTDGHNLGAVPGPIDLSHINSQVVTLPRSSASLPSSYDLRDVPNKLPPVRNQFACGSCWSFAAYGSLESCLLPGESWNFSEMDLICSHGFDYAPCYGGERWMATAYLARWDGPVEEACYPYYSSCLDSRPLCDVQKHIQEVDFIPDRDDMTIKNAIMNYGAVYTTMYIEPYAPYFNEANAAYYYDGDEPLNHAVCIVGWDDDYPASNFLITPPGDGAFIIRNSWDSSWGEGGYFYISYYDTAIGYDNALFRNAESTTNYLTKYDYDPLGWVLSLGVEGSTTCWGANVFTAIANESLVAVTTYAASANTAYELSVYTNVDSNTLPGPINGTLAPGFPRTGTFNMPGYQRIDLISPDIYEPIVELTKDQKFSIVLKLTTPDYDYPVPIEIPIYNYSSAATANFGESYASSCGLIWQDTTTIDKDINVCIKAFTATDNCPNDPYKVEPGACGCGNLDSDTDQDGTAECIDNCPGISNPDQLDTDGNGEGDICDPDDDGDGILDDGDGSGIEGDNPCPNGVTTDCDDNCPKTLNSLQFDNDEDGLGNRCDDCMNDPENDIDGDGACGDREECPYDPDKKLAGICGCGVPDTDTDGDATPDCNDNCPNDPNKSEPGICGCGILDADSDGDGSLDCHDICPFDPDNDKADGDGVCGDVDNCPTIANPGQENADGDGAGDVCDSCPNDPDNDIDGDGVCGDVDNCPDDANPGQENADGDALGDACDDCPNDPKNDIDGDGVCGDVDNCPDKANPGQEDDDGDGVGEACDPCPDDPGNDPDGDGVCSRVDNCPTDYNPGQETSGDNDSHADACDNCPNVDNEDQADADGDGIGDLCDNCQDDANADQLDNDGDELGDVCDPDDDNDDINDDDDNCDLIYNPAQLDGNGNGIGDCCDPDGPVDGCQPTIVINPAEGIALAEVTGGQNAPDATFTVNNGGSGALVYSLELTKAGINNWIVSCSPEMGTSLSDNDKIQHTLTFDTTALPNGIFKGIVTLKTRSTTVPDAQAVDIVEIPVTVQVKHKSAPPPVNPDIKPQPPVPDADKDTIADDDDNCPNTANTDQKDTDSDGVGDVCDNCVEKQNEDQLDADDDKVGDACDNCVDFINPNQNDTDDDKVGDVCDNCPDAANPNQSDADIDGIGDACDPTPLGEKDETTPAGDNNNDQGSTTSNQGGTPSNQGNTTPPAGQTTPQTQKPPAGQQQPTTVAPPCGFGVVQTMMLSLTGFVGLRLVNRRRRP